MKIIAPTTIIIAIRSHRRFVIVASILVVLVGVSASAMFIVANHRRAADKTVSQSQSQSKSTNSGKGSVSQENTSTAKGEQKDTSPSGVTTNASGSTAPAKKGTSGTATSKPGGTTTSNNSTHTGGGTTTPPSTPSEPTSPITPPQATRDPLQQPFSSASIWNMPIGSGAQYVSAGLPANPGSDNWTPMPQIDNDIIVMKPTAPLTNIMYSNVGWSGGNRCNVTGGLLTSVPIPSGFLVGNSRDNNGAAFLMADGRTIVQTQPFTRCTIGGVATSLVTFAAVDLYGDGITGAHGGSGLSAIGGTIRLGELRPGQQGPHHALKINVDAPQFLYRCKKESDCHRWPAVTSDSGSVGDYGSATNNQNYAMRMGALLALPPSVNIAGIGLESEPGKQLAWTLQNYGAYIVDATGGSAYAIEAEIGPDGSKQTEFKNDYGYPMEQRVNSNTAWSRDIQRLMPKLQVVNNNSSNSIGGGGTPRQPLAPAIAP